MLSSFAPDADLIACFYEAAATRQGWGEAWSALCAAFGAEAGLLFRRSRPASQPFVLASRNWPLETHDGRLRGDPAWPAEPQAAAFTLCTTALLEGTAVIGMGLQRQTGAPFFTEAEHTALDGLGRHVAAAVRLEALLAAERFASAVRGAAMDVSPNGIIVLGSRGTILFSNAVARRMAADSGLLLDCWGEARLTGPSAEKLEALAASVAAGGPGGCVSVPRAHARAPLAATVEPLGVQLANQAGLPASAMACVMITLRDLGATIDAPPMALMELFGLTAAEAGIVPQLLCGESTSLIAQSRGVAAGTVKAQAARVLAKTGAANLRALSAMIAALGCG